MTTRDRVLSTIEYLRLRILARDAGYPVAFTTDPNWLLHQAINRRAGWLDDPSGSRGSAMPVRGRYPRKAQGDWQRDARDLARRMRTRIFTRRRECMPEFRARLAHRIHDDNEE